MHKHRAWIGWNPFFLYVYVKTNKKIVDNCESFIVKEEQKFQSEQTHTLDAAYPEDTNYYGENLYIPNETKSSSCTNYQLPAILFHSECQISLIVPILFLIRTQQ